MVLEKTQILNQIIDNFDSKKILSFDIKDFNLSSKYVWNIRCNTTSLFL